MEVRSQGEDWGWWHEHSLKGASAPQLAGRASGKKSGPAGEAGDDCFGVRAERGFLLHVPTDGTAPTKRAPEMGASRGDQLGPQRRVWTTNAAIGVPRSLCASAGHYPHPTPPGSLCSPPLPGSRDPGTTSRENTQHSSGWCNIMLASAAAGSPCIPVMTSVPFPLPGLSEQESPNQQVL